MDDINEIAAERAGVSRRVVVKSAAWSLPVFAAVGITPAFAASGLTSSSLNVAKSGNFFTGTWIFSSDVSAISFQDLQLNGVPQIQGNRVTFTAQYSTGTTIPTFTALVTAGSVPFSFSVTGVKLTGNTAVALSVRLI